MSWMKGKSSGWTAFDLKQKQKQQGYLENNIKENDPFPPVSTNVNTTSSLDIRGKYTRTHESFSSMNLPTLKEKKDRGSGSRSNLILPVNSHDDSGFKKLKEMNRWADDNLIRDILLSTEDNFDMALEFLKGMVIKDDEESISISKIDDHSSELDGIIQRLHSFPIEPEYEEDDLYLHHRKDALKIMRSASNHSRAAQNAFMRYDHVSAKYHSEKAREDWLTAEKLNSEASKTILGITNKNNDTWKLDLHGLHATEAVQALQQRLQHIEGQCKINRSISPNRGSGRSKNVAIRSASQEPFCRLDDVDRQRTSSSREIRNSLQVITGIGKHSREYASLPIAVKTFLEDSRYRFDETRPGVITVRPKFRYT